jgi:hypothetical protein
MAGMSGTIIPLVKQARLFFFAKKKQKLLSIQLRG